MIYQLQICAGTMGQSTVSAHMKGSLRTASPPLAENRL